MLLPDIFIFPWPRRLFPAGAALFWREARFISRELIMKKGPVDKGQAGKAITDLKVVLASRGVTF